MCFNNLLKKLCLIGAIYSFLACNSNNPTIKTRDPSFEYFVNRIGTRTHELKLKFNASHNEVVEAYYKPAEEKKFIPLAILSKNENPQFYFVNYSEFNQSIRLFTDFSTGASLFFSIDNYLTFNKEFFIESDDKKSVLITSGLPSFTPFYLTDPQQSFIHAFIPSPVDTHSLYTNSNSIVFHGSLSNGNNATIVASPDTQNPNLISFTLETNGQKTTFKHAF